MQTITQLIKENLFKMENEADNLAPMLEEKIRQVITKISTDPNPEELENIKKIIRKNVPFFSRGAFSAYLLRELAASRQPRDAKKPFDRDKKEVKPALQKKKEAVQKPQEEEKPHQTEQEKEEKKEDKVLPEGAKTLYLNIGKMKRLYAKQLSSLLQEELGIQREDIYTLRIHDKYSFITMSEENCQKAIEKLNGMDINGRTAQINYSNR